MTEAKPQTNARTSTSKPPTEQQPKLATRELNFRNGNLPTNDPDKPVRKLPPIKASVGLAKGPDLRNCKSKVGSLHNIKHSPQSSGVRIESQKLVWNAKSKVGSLENKEHIPGGGKLKLESRKLEWKTSPVASKVQSLANVHHKPGGGNVKIFNESYAEKRSTKEQKNKDNSQDENNNKSEEELSRDLKNLNLKS